MTAMHELSETPEPLPIPRELHSEYTERPFRHCSRCGETLTDFEGGFQISKAFKKGECVFEYALCDHCRTGLMEEFSEESKARLMEFQTEKVNFERGLDGCSVCGITRSGSPLKEFVLTGICEHDKLLHGMMVCGKCGEQTQELISTHTRDTWRRFIADNFPGPPSDALPTPEPVGVPVF
jgi:ribosomal protein S27AE